MCNDCGVRLTDGLAIPPTVSQHLDARLGVGVTLTRFVLRSSLRGLGELG